MAIALGAGGVRANAERSADAGDVPHNSVPPAWYSRYQPLMDALEAEHVSYLCGSRDAFYAETGRRWLCLRDGVDLHCQEWPAGAPRLTDVAINRNTAERVDGLLLYADEVIISATVRAVAGSLRLGRLRRTRREDESSTPPSRRNPRQRPSRDPDLDAPGGLVLADHAGVPAALAHAMTTLTADDPSARVWSVEQSGTSLVTVVESIEASGELDRAWTCHRPAGSPRICGETAIADARALIPTRTLPGGWLLRAPAAGLRWASLALVWVAPGPTGLETATLDLGGAQGSGESCRFTRGYCVFMEGAFTPYELLAPGCVRVGATTLWSALHVRMADRWLHEKRWRAPPDHAPRPGTYRPAGSEWVPAPCADAAK